MMVRFLIIGLLLPTLAWAQTDDAGKTAKSGNLSVLSEKSLEHFSVSGEFRVTFPSGCGKIVTKVPVEGDGEMDGLPAVRVSITYCDRHQGVGEGCSVTSYFNVTNKDGGYPEPEQTVERVVRSLKSMNVVIKKEVSLRKELPDGTVIEGVDVFAAEASGSGQAWVRGLLYEGDIYIMSAWKSTGDLWGNPDFIDFFNSFKPGVK